MGLKECNFYYFCPVYVTIERSKKRLSTVELEHTKKESNERNVMRSRFENRKVAELQNVRNFFYCVITLCAHSDGHSASFEFAFELLALTHKSLSLLCVERNWSNNARESWGIYGNSFLLSASRSIYLILFDKILVYTRALYKWIIRIERGEEKAEKKFFLLIARYLFCHSFLSLLFKTRIS